MPSKAKKPRTEEPSDYSSDDDGESDASGGSSGEDPNLAAIKRAVRTFKLYRAWARRCSDQMHLQGKLMPEEFATVVPRAEFVARAEALRHVADTNADFFEAVAKHTAEQWWPQHVGSAFVEMDPAAADPEEDQESLWELQMTVTSMVREWSSEGEAGRATTYEPIVDAIARHLPVDPSAPFAQRVLVPGGGLGRLGFDAAAAGYAVEINELDTLQVLVGDFLLHADAGAWRIHPYFGEPTNHATFANRVRAVQVPDTAPTKLLSAAAVPREEEGGGDGEEDEGDDGMAPLETTIGDFCALYGEPEVDENGEDGDDEGESSTEGAFDAVASSFFMDTSPLPMRYLKAIRRVLRPGGVFVNLGPLEWTWGPSGERAWQMLPPAPGEGAGGKGAGDEFAGAMDLAWEDVLRMVAAAGFEVVEHGTRPGCTYKDDSRSLVQSKFECGFFVARRV